MSKNLIEQAREYSAANGGHAANAVAAGVTLSHFIDVVSGRTPVSRPFAVAMAPLIGCTATALMAENSDLQLLLMRGAAP